MKPMVARTGWSPRQCWAGEGFPAARLVAGWVPGFVMLPEGLWGYLWDRRRWGSPCVHGGLFRGKHVVEIRRHPATRGAAEGTDPGLEVF